jgi:ADP-ribose pyrophosphatase YjhB (NUDIX family)
MAQLSWKDSYLGKLRSAVGDQKLLNVACRGIVVDDEGKVLFVQRADNGKWVMPAGAMEIDESVEDGLKREVWEETGLEVESAELIAVNSDPKKYSYNSWGYDYQMVSFVFLVTSWKGSLLKITPETTDARFIDLQQISEYDIPNLYIETLRDLEQYKETGKVAVK